MVKTKAEVQKAYRERKKLKEGDEYLERERKRVLAYYVPVAEQSTEKATERRTKVREYVRKHRQKRKESNVVKDVHASSESSQDEVNQAPETISSNTCTSTLLVKMSFMKNRTRTRVSRATARCRKEVKKLERVNGTLQKRYKRLSKRYERLAKKQKVENETENCDVIIDKSAEMTPRKRTNNELREDGISPSKIPKLVREKLVFANVITQEIGDAYKENNEKGKACINRVISGNLLKKYRMKKVLGTKTGIRRKSISSLSRKDLRNTPRRTKNLTKTEQTKQSIRRFLERDDNSRILPGKNDKVKTSEGHLQKRVLNDSMAFLHLKYKAETTSKISLASFCRMRPRHTALTKYISRNKCLCQKHQNMALALKAMRSAGIEVPLNPDEFSRLYATASSDVDALFTDLKDDNIKLSQWQKVQMTDGKKKTKIVETTLNKVDFISKMKQQIVEFIGHVHRVKEQYKALNNLKENLPEGHVIVQMDFAENFICNSADEVQSAYWNSTAVTLHPVVFYYKKDECLRHQNLVFVSDDLGHNIGSVFGILKKLVPEIKNVAGEVRRVHYWTDSPSSQYRNKTSFYIVSDHEALFGMPACWNFFETGHGKGPCDGIGGTAKRMADQAIKQGKFAVQDANDFFEHVQTLHRSAKYVFMSSNEAETARTETNEMNKNLVPVKGTLQLHYVFGVSKGLIKTRLTSCYCETCLENRPHDFNVASLIKVHIGPTNMIEKGPENDGEEANQTSSESNALPTEITEENRTEAENVDLKVGDWIAVTYDGRWYIGRIQCVDEADGEFEVKFLRQTKSREENKLLFKWPPQDDILDVAIDDVLCKIAPPCPAEGVEGTLQSIPTTINSFCKDIVAYK